MHPKLSHGGISIERMALVRLSLLGISYCWNNAANWWSLSCLNDCFFHNDFLLEFGVDLTFGERRWDVLTHSQYMFRSNRILFPPCKNPAYFISPRIFRWGRNCWKGKIRQEDLKAQEVLPWEGICFAAFADIICKSEIMRTWKSLSYSNRHPFSNIELGMIRFANWTFEKLLSDKPNCSGSWNEERFVAVDPNLQIGYIGEVRGDVPLHIPNGQSYHTVFLSATKIGLQKSHSFSDEG